MTLYKISKLNVLLTEGSTNAYNTALCSEVQRKSLCASVCQQPVVSLNIDLQC